MRLFEELEHRSRDLYAVQSVLGLLSWDQETLMPAKGAPFRARQRAAIAALLHDQTVSDGLARLLEQLEPGPLDDLQRCCVRELRRLYEKEVRKPQSLVRALAKIASEAYEHWVQAREASDFRLFAPWLEQMLVLKREEADCLGAADSLYQTLLDEFEPGMTTAALDEYFGFLRPRLTRLVQRIADCRRGRPVPPVQGSFPRRQQERLAREVLSSMGFDWEAGRVDTSPHPFCSGLSPKDVRLTTRFDESDFTRSWFGIIHEGGHALYEQGLNAEYYGLPACEAISLGIHESQSRLWENQIARSRPFWVHWLPRLQACFPGQLEAIDTDTFLLQVNRVEPSLVRVEADEVTYGLHVILRYELEKGLVSQTIRVADLPDAWNQKMEEYLGVRPPNDALGVLQDTHWSQGLIGYFPTYLLGNLYASQWMQRIAHDLPDLDDQLARGQMSELREWLRRTIHHPGKLYSAAELVEQVTGQPLSADFFMEYLESKYSRLYQL